MDSGGKESGDPTKEVIDVDDLPDDLIDIPEDSMQEPHPNEDMSSQDQQQSRSLVPFEPEETQSRQYELDPWEVPARVPPAAAQSSIAGTAIPMRFLLDDEETDPWRVPATLDVKMKRKLDDDESSSSSSSSSDMCLVQTAAQAEDYMQKRREQTAAKLRGNNRLADYMQKNPIPNERNLKCKKDDIDKESTDDDEPPQTTEGGTIANPIDVDDEPSGDDESESDSFINDDSTSDDADSSEEERNRRKKRRAEEHKKKL